MEYGGGCVHGDDCVYGDGVQHARDEVARVRNHIFIYFQGVICPAALCSSTHRVAYGEHDGQPPRKGS